MNKRELIEKVAEKNGTSKVEAAKAVNAVIGTIAETLKKVEKISLLELGSFAIRERKERNGCLLYTSRYGGAYEPED